ncbi:MAG: HepT-like ribonuclease domain-containing protein [Dermatophilaceae bacterium]
MTGAVRADATGIRARSRVDRHRGSWCWRWLDTSPLPGAASSAGPTRRTTTFQRQSHRSHHSLCQQALRRSALLWHFTVLGEAASQIPSETKDSHPKIAWRAATRLRNRIVHGYWDIDVETLVTTAADDLPHMITQLDGAITSLREIEDSHPPVSYGLRLAGTGGSRW